MNEPTVSYTSQKTYSIRNEQSLLQDEPVTIWFTIHGMGYLSRYFINYFERLDPLKNYIIAPQAPSKYYQDKKFKYVGASWLTRDNLELEKENIYAYLDAVWETESSKWKNKPGRFIFMGYSQGVSIITRWMSRRKLSCDFLLLHSGAIPKELEKSDFDYLPREAQVTYLYGTRDEYINEARKTEQQILGSKVFGDRLEIVTFEGTHEVHTEFLLSLSQEFDSLT